MRENLERGCDFGTSNTEIDACVLLLQNIFTEGGVRMPGKFPRELGTTERTGSLAHFRMGSLFFMSIGASKLNVC
jgi:hypothetical protein